MASRSRSLFSTRWQRVRIDILFLPTMMAEGAQGACLPTHHHCFLATKAMQAATQHKHTLTLHAGACPKSYGMNVARLAGLPEAVVSRAVEIAHRTEVGQSTQARFEFEQCFPAIAVHTRVWLLICAC